MACFRLFARYVLQAPAASWRELSRACRGWKRRHPLGLRLPCHERVATFRDVHGSRCSTAKRLLEARALSLSLEMLVDFFSGGGRQALGHAPDAEDFPGLNTGVAYKAYALRLQLCFVGKGWLK